MDRVDYSNDTPTASPKGPLSAAKWYMGSTSNLDYGYWTGGRNEPAGNVGTSIIERLDFASDTTTASPKGYMDSAKHSTGNTSARANGMPTANPPVAAPVQPPFPYPVQAHNPAGYGYFAGGYSTSPSSTVLSQTQRIDFSNDTATAVLKGNLTINAASADKQSGTGSPSHGYIAGGNPSSTNADRIDYSNDTATTSPKGALLVRRNNHAAVGNKDYLYNGGGGYGSPTTSKIDRLDYASDTSTAAEKGPLSSARYYLAAVGNASYGYFAGGYPGNKSTVDRVDYSSDTDTASPKGPLSSGRYGAGGTSNASYGWIAGVRQPSKSIVDRIDFSNDTATSSPKGPMASANGYKA